MKSSTKAKVLKFAKTVIVKTVEQFQKWSAEFVLNERELNRLQTRMQADIDKVKERYRPEIEYRLEARAKITPFLVEYARGLWNGKSAKQPFDFVNINWSIPRGSLRLDNEEATIKQLKVMGITDLIRVREEVKKDEFKERFGKEPDLMKATFGAEIVKGEATPTVEVNWQKVGTTLEAELKAAERLSRGEGLLKAV